MDRHSSETSPKHLSAPLALGDLTMGFGNGGLDQLIFGTAQVESHGSMRATSGKEHSKQRGVWDEGGDTCLEETQP